MVLLYYKHDLPNTKIPYVPYTIKTHLFMSILSVQVTSFGHNIPKQINETTSSHDNVALQADSKKIKTIKTPKNLFVMFLPKLFLPLLHFLSL